MTTSNTPPANPRTNSNVTALSGIATDPIWVDNNAQLAELCQRWQQQAAIAVDTEFMRSQTFYPHAGLIQIGDGKGCYLIDPLAVTDFSPLTELFIDANVVKVLHSCSEDLEVFQYLLGVIPTPLFDTQVAAAFCGHGLSVGYAGLLSAVLNIDLDKGETRSDWMQRPLSQSQLHYAALDVAYLLIIYGKQLQQLKSLQRLEWVLADCQRLIDQAKIEVCVNSAYQKVRSAWKLSRRELAVLQALSRWREQEGRNRDIPRNRLLRENALWELAKRQPSELSQLFGVDGLHSRVVKTDGAVILQLIQAAQKIPDEQLPEPLPAPLPPTVSNTLKRVKAAVRELAESLNMAPEVLVRKKDYEAFMRSGMQGHYEIPDRLRDWRYDVVADLMLGVVQSR